MCKTEMIMRGSTALESANALFRRAQVPANAERLCSNIWDGVTATRSTRRWLHRGRAFAVAPSSFALDIPHVAFSTGEGEFPASCGIRLLSKVFWPKLLQNT